MQIARIGTQLAAVVVAALVAACGGGESAPSESAQARAELPPFNFEIRTLSNRADLVSDGNALVEVDVPKNVPMHQVTLKLNGVDVGSALRKGAGPGELRALISETWRRRIDRGAEDRLAMAERRRPLIQIGELKRDPHLEMHTRGG